MRKREVAPSHLCVGQAIKPGSCQCEKPIYVQKQTFPLCLITGLKRRLSPAMHSQTSSRTDCGNQKSKSRFLQGLTLWHKVILVLEFTPYNLSINLLSDCIKCRKLRVAALALRHERMRYIGYIPPNVRLSVRGPGIIYALENSVAGPEEARHIILNLS